MLGRSTDKLDLAALRGKAVKRPRTKAGQIRQAWPEIRYLLASGHSLKDVWIWLKEIGIVIPYTRLSEYVSELRRGEGAPSAFRPQSTNAPPVAQSEPKNRERGGGPQEPRQA